MSQHKLLVMTPILRCQSKATVLDEMINYNAFAGETNWQGYEASFCRLVSSVIIIIVLLFIGIILTFLPPSCSIFTKNIAWNLCMTVHYGWNYAERDAHQHLTRHTISVTFAKMGPFCRPWLSNLFSEAPIYSEEEGLRGRGCEGREEGTNIEVSVRMKRRRLLASSR